MLQCDAFREAKIDSNQNAFAADFRP